MKKIFFSFLAIAAIASCAKTEAVFTEGNSEIKIKPATTVATKANHLGVIDGTTYPVAENFDVYGYWATDWTGVTDPTAYLITTEGGAEFENKGNYWGGVTPYHWPKNGSIKFAAYSPASENFAHVYATDTYSKTGYVQPSNTAETWDLLFAKTTAPYTAMTAAENVSVVFEHALSWITLQVRAKDDVAAGVFDIKEVKINDVFTKADAAIAMGDGIQAEEWTNHAEAKPYVVYTGSQVVGKDVAVIENTTAGTIVIPQNTTSVTINYTQNTIEGSTVKLENQSITLDLILDADQTTWEPGKHYTYTLVFGLDEILINPSVVDWDEEDQGCITADPGVRNVSTQNQFQAALDDPTTVKIVFQDNIVGDFVAPEEAGRTLIIDGNNYKLKGSILINGKSVNANATTIFQNIKFEANDVSTMVGASFIYCGEEKGTGFRYPDNVTIKNCTFTSTYPTVEAVAAKFWSLKGNLVVENCQAKGLHSFMQLTSCKEAVVDVIGVTIEDSKNGISLDNASATVRNSKIVTNEYGIRANGDRNNADLDVVKTTITAEKPIIVRKLTLATYNVALDNATLNTTNADQPFAVVFTKNSDDKEFVAPTGKYTITGAEGYSVFPKNAAMSKETFETALANADVDVIEVVANLEYTTNESVSIEKNVTINANGKTITAGGAASLTPSVAVRGEYEVAINEANIVGGFVGAYYGANVTVDGGSLKFTDGKSGRNCFYAASTTTAKAVITIKDVDVNMANANGNSYLCAHGNAVIYVQGGKFYGKTAGSSNPYVKEVSVSGYTGEVIITGGTFNFDPSAWVATGYKAVPNGSNWTVVAE